MLRFLMFNLLMMTTSVTATVSAQNGNEEAIAKDHEQIRGTWQVTSLTINGNPAKKEDARKITVVNGKDGKWSVRSEGKEISKGDSTVDPTQKPKTIDFTPTEGGGKGEQFRGIYQLSEKTRKLCFAPAGDDRPKEFASTAENQHILVTFKRIK